MTHYMKHLKTLSLWAITAVMFAAAMVHSAPKGDMPKARYGAVAVATASATLVFTAMTGRNTFSLQNLGPNAIYCGYDSAVTTATGTQVASGAFLAVDLVANSTTDTAVYCIAASALQVSPADTRWMQVK